MDSIDINLGLLINLKTKIERSEKEVILFDSEKGSTFDENSLPKNMLVYIKTKLGGKNREIYNSFYYCIKTFEKNYITDFDDPEDNNYCIFIFKIDDYWHNLLGKLIKHEKEDYSSLIRENDKYNRYYGKLFKDCQYTFYIKP